MFPEQKGINACNPPAGAAAIKAAEKELGACLPEDLRKRYRRYDGVDAYAAREMPFHLMPLAEVLALHAERDGSAVHDVMHKFGLVNFWTDDQSNFASTALTGPLAGYGFIYDHDQSSIFGRLTPVISRFDQLAPQIQRATERNLLRIAFESGACEDRDFIEQSRHYRAYFPYVASEDDVDWRSFAFDYPKIEAYEPRDQRAFHFLQSCLSEASANRVEEEERFLVESMAFLCPPGKWQELATHFETHPAVLRILAVRYFEEMLPTMVSVLAGRGEEPYNLLAKGVFVRGEREAQVRGCLTRQGLSCAHFSAALEQIQRWPSLALQW